jgi:cysteinyl-tRNA synthetase
VVKRHLENFKAAVQNNLDTPAALAIMRRAVSDPDISPGDRRALAFEMDKIFGLKLNTAERLYKIPLHIKTLVRGRELLRRNQQFVKGDTLRRKVESLGYEIEDTSYGPFVWPNHKHRRRSRHKT